MWFKKCMERRRKDVENDGRGEAVKVQKSICICHLPTTEM
jgi:hypothetical protein